MRVLMTENLSETKGKCRQLVRNLTKFSSVCLQKFFAKIVVINTIYYFTRCMFEVLSPMKKVVKLHYTV